MTRDAAATTDRVAMDDSRPLVARVRASQLPPPAERRAIRVGADVTLREIADELGVSRTAVLHWERGTRKISREYAIAYRRVLDGLRRAATS